MFCAQYDYQYDNPNIDNHIDNHNNQDDDVDDNPSLHRHGTLQFAKPRLAQWVVPGSKSVVGAPFSRPSAVAVVGHLSLLWMWALSQGSLGSAHSDP